MSPAPSSEVHKLGPEGVTALRTWFDSLDEITPFLAEPKKASLVACYGIQREIGGPNDEIARFLFDARTGQPVDPATLSAEIIRWKDFFGLRIKSSTTADLEVRVRGFADLRHPLFTDLVLFPELIARILERRGIEAVLVKRWGLNSIFGGFDAARIYYQANMWELAQNDGLFYAGLVAEGRMALLGTHDVVGHAANANREAWSRLRELGRPLHRRLADFFGPTETGNTVSLVLSYAIGTIFDDLAQPVNYDSPTHRFILEGLVAALDRLDPRDPLVLDRFPESFSELVKAARRTDLDETEQHRRVEDFLKDLGLS